MIASSFRIRLRFLATFVVAAATASALQAAIISGDVIKLDFSTAGNGDGVLTNWNSVGSDAAINDPIRHSDGAAVTGVSVTFTKMINGRFNNDGNAANWGGLNND